jgi:hypothetical protein
MRKYVSRIAKYRALLRAPRTAPIDYLLLTIAHQCKCKNMELLVIGKSCGNYRAIARLIFIDPWKNATGNNVCL